MVLKLKKGDENWTTNTEKYGAKESFATSNYSIHSTQYKKNCSGGGELNRIITLPISNSSTI